LKIEKVLKTSAHIYKCG